MCLQWNCTTPGYGLFIISLMAVFFLVSASDLSANTKPPHVEEPVSTASPDRKKETLPLPPAKTQTAKESKKQEDPLPFTQLEKDRLQNLWLLRAWLQ